VRSGQPTSGADFRLDWKTKAYRACPAVTRARDRLVFINPAHRKCRAIGRQSDTPHRSEPSDRSHRPSSAPPIRIRGRSCPAGAVAPRRARRRTPSFAHGRPTARERRRRDHGDDLLRHRIGFERAQRPRRIHGIEQADLRHGELPHASNWFGSLPSCVIYATPRVPVPAWAITESTVAAGTAVSYRTGYAILFPGSTDDVDRVRIGTVGHELTAFTSGCGQAGADAPSNRGCDQ